VDLILWTGGGDGDRAGLVRDDFGDLRDDLDVVREDSVLFRDESADVLCEDFVEDFRGSSIIRLRFSPKDIKNFIVSQSKTKSLVSNLIYSFS
jgi:hypothetical protein